MPVTTTIAPPEQRVILENVSWETYERLLAESIESAGTRFTYDDGALEIMVVSIAHEYPNRTLALLVEIVAMETERSLHRAGSTTFKRKDLLKGFEPDSCFYISHAEQARGREELDPVTDPPPDLVIEVDITRSSLSRFPIFAALGVPEVWRFDGDRVTMYRLESGRYVEIEASLALPPLTASQSTVFLDESRREKSTVWFRRVQEWARSSANPRS
jgi:Uma2 family endonuclease